jgi:hypothetical protein
MGGLKRNLARERGHGPKLSNPIFTHRVHGSASIAAERIAGESNRNVHERAALLAGKRASTLRLGYRSHTTHHLSTRDANKITQTPEDNKPTAPFAVEEDERNRVKNTPAVALPVYSPEFGLQAAAARPAYGLAVSRASDTLLSCFLSLPVRFWVSTHQGTGMGGRLQARGGEKLPLIMAVAKASIKLHFVTPLSNGITQSYHKHQRAARKEVILC